MKRMAVALLILLLFCMCNQGRTEGITDITAKLDKSTGFVDLTFSIVNEKETDSTYLYQVQALYLKDTVGIEISLKKNLDAQITEDSINNCISFRSMGVESDKLLTSMAKLYETNFIPSSIRKDEMNFTSLSLNSNRIDYKKGSYTFKVLMENKEDAPELYVIFDFTNNQIQFNEKDVEFRESILAYFANKSRISLPENKNNSKI